MPLTIEAPAGSHFDFDEVKTNRGTDSLGDVPLLVWDSLDGAVDHYGQEGITDILDGTSLRVSFQGIARRMKVAGKTDDEIAQAQVAFRPGKRGGGSSTPVSRAKNAAKDAAEKVGDGDLVAQLLARIASGDISAEDVKTLVS